MQQRTSKLLYGYWNTVRDGRMAPCRFEIEPSKIAALLPETFIAESHLTADYRVRLAGTRICFMFGRELRDTSLLDLWPARDRHAMETLIENVVSQGAVALAHFAAQTEDGQRRADFEISLMPMTLKAGSDVDRLLGALTPINPPFWLGTAPLQVAELKTTELIWPDGKPTYLSPRRVAEAVTASVEDKVPLALDGEGQITGDARRRFRVYEGGLSERPR